MRLGRRFFFLLFFPISTFAQTTYSCPSNQYVTTQLINTGQGCSALPTAVTNVSGATSGGFAVSTTSPGTTPVVSVAPDATHYLPTAIDQTAWNAKQAAGSYITALAGDVTAAGPGSAAASVIKVNGGALPIGGGLTTTNSSGQLVAQKQFFTLDAFGDSWLSTQSSYGPTGLFTTSLFALLLKDTPTMSSFMQNDFALGGTTAPQIATSALASFNPNPIRPTLSIENGGNNDAATFDSCGNIAGTSCVKNYINSLNALEAWTTIPYQYREMASAATSTGTWAISTTLALHVNGNYSSPGTAMSSATSGSTRTFTLTTPSASTTVGLTYAVSNSFTGTFTVVVDGVSQTDMCSGTTTFSSGPCGAVALANATSAPFRQEFAVTAATSHTVVVTNTNSASTPIISADVVPPAGTPNTNVVFIMGTVVANDSGGIYNSASQALATQELADGLPVYFVDLQNGTPGVNGTSDVSVTKTTSCPASTFAKHPNDCGIMHERDTIYNTESQYGYFFSYMGAGGQVSLPVTGDGTYVPSLSGTPSTSEMMCSDASSLFPALTDCAISKTSVSSLTTKAALGVGAVTATPGSGVTSATCNTASCTISRGTYTIAGGTATTGTILTLAWPTTTTAWNCWVTQNGGASYFGMGHSAATATGMNITAAATIAGATVVFDYACQP